MIYVYRLFIYIVIILSPIIIIIRIFKKKENSKRFLEKFSFFKEKREVGDLIWFHGASVGELKSIIPILNELEKNIKIKQILVTSNTLSSSKVLEKYKFKKVVHQFFPIDNYYVVKNFINYWKPIKVFFIDSEIWPNLIFYLHEKKISFGLINARLSKKSYERWKFFSNFSKTIFTKFDFCLTANLETKRYLKNLKVKKIKFIGNLKFVRNKREKIIKFKNIEKLLRNKKIWCASSTHKNEELVCGNVHINLKKKYKNLLTIIIPRHIERVPYIKKDLEKLGLVVHVHNSKKKNFKGIDVYIVNTYGETNSFYNVSKNIFMGGSLIEHGGQNPLEAVRFGCRIIHGPNIYNFKEIYAFLKKKGLSKEVSSSSMLEKYLDKNFSTAKNKKKIQTVIKVLGNDILKKTYDEIKKT